MSVPPEVERARETGQPLRVHTQDGEVVVARVLSYDDVELVYVALQSSHPERYGVCDSTGFSLPFHAIRRLQLLRDPMP